MHSAMKTINLTSAGMVTTSVIATGAVAGYMSGNIPAAALMTGAAVFSGLSTLLGIARIAANEITNKPPQAPEPAANNTFGPKPADRAP